MSFFKKIKDKMMGTTKKLKKQFQLPKSLKKD